MEFNCKNEQKKKGSAHSAHSTYSYSTLYEVPYYVFIAYVMMFKYFGMALYSRVYPVYETVEPGLRYIFAYLEQWADMNYILYPSPSPSPSEGKNGGNNVVPPVLGSLTPGVYEKVKGINVDTQSCRYMNPLKEASSASCLPKNDCVVPELWPAVGGGNTTDKMEHFRTFDFGFIDKNKPDQKLWTMSLINQGKKVFVGLRDYVINGKDGNDGVDPDDGTVTDYNVIQDENKTDIDNLCEFYKANTEKFEASVTVISIANEPLSTPQSLNLLMKRLKYIKKKRCEGSLPKNVKITVVINFNSSETQNWVQKSYPPVECFFTEKCLQILKECEIIAFNCYGSYFNKDDFGIDIFNSTSLNPNDVKGSVVVNQILGIRAAMTKAKLEDKRLWIGEVGWASLKGVRVIDPSVQPQPSSTNSKDWASISNLKTFYQNFLDIKMDQKIKTNIGGVNYEEEWPDHIYYFTLRNSFNPASFNFEGNNTYEFEYFGLYSSKKEDVIFESDTLDQGKAKLLSSFKLN